jgi:hypothetical protein
MINKLEFTETTLEHLRHCKTVNGVYNNDALCWVPNLVQIAEWAQDQLANDDRWHDYPAEKPPKQGMYLCAMKNGSVSSYQYRNDYNQFDCNPIDNPMVSTNDTDVLYWRQRPKHPKKESK